MTIPVGKRVAPDADVVRWNPGAMDVKAHPAESGDMPR
jgi:hypothetical protein